MGDDGRLGVDKMVISDDESLTLTAIRNRITHPERGLPDQVFRFALHVVPMVNVDLVVLDDRGRALWAWRDDEFGRGWHIPGSIVRVGEPIADRIAATAANELSADVVAEDAPRAIVQFFSVRGTFISLVYRCRLLRDAQVSTTGDCREPRPGDLAWIVGMPERVYPVHACYRRILPICRNDVAGAPLMLTVNG